MARCRCVDLSEFGRHPHSMVSCLFLFLRPGLVDIVDVGVVNVEDVEDVDDVDVPDALDGR